MSDPSPAAGGTKPVTAYPPLTPAEAAAELGVQLTERLQPDLSAAVPKRFVSLEEAKARGWSWHYTGRACRYSHQAARRTSNPAICSDCVREKNGQPAVYQKSTAQQFYAKPRRPAKDPSAPVVIAPAIPAPLKPDKREQEFLAKFAELRNVERAAEAVGLTVGQVESRRSSDPTFAAAVQDLTSRLDIPWTRAPDVSGFRWTPELERTFASRYVDCGLLMQVREEMGVSASAYHDRLQSSPTFAALIDAATPLARETLRDRATQAASVGKVDLLKFLEKDEEENSISSMTVPEINAEIQTLLRRFEAQGLFPPKPTAYINKKTGQTIDAVDLLPVEEFNADLVGGA